MPTDTSTIRDGIVASGDYFGRLLEVVASVADKPLVTDPRVMKRLAAQLHPQPGGYRLPVTNLEDVMVAGPHGDVPVRVYSRGPGAGRPLVLFCHGGGFIQGDLNTLEADATARELVRRIDVVVVSVDYRLAQGPISFPIPLDDVEAAYNWATTADLGTDQVFVAGGSAGSVLVTGLVVRLRDFGQPMPDGQILLYPLTHPVLPPPSAELAQKLAALSPAGAFAPEVLTPIIENYLGAPVSEACPQAMAALADPHDVPQTLIINSEYDGLRASGEAYAAYLESAGVAVEVHCAPDVLHGHFDLPWLPQTQAGLDTIAAWLAARQSDR